MNEIRGLEDSSPADPNPQGQVGSDPGIDKIAVSQVIGLETEADRAKYGDDLENIVNWCKREGYKSPEQLKWIVKSLMAKLGTPPLGEKWVTAMGRFAYLDLQVEKLEAEKYSLMR